MKAKEQNVPVLRFPGFDGEWVEKRLVELASTMKSGAGITSSNIFDAGTYPVYGGNGLRGYTEKYTHEGEFFLIGRQGALCGNINRVSGQVFISEHAIATQGNKDSDTDWLAHKLEFMNLNRLSESSAQPGLSVKKLKRLKIKSPSKPEQQKIASFLTAVDSKIEQLSKKKALLEQYKKGMMQKLFSQELRFKDEQGNDFPDWEEKRLKDCCQINPKTTELPAEFVYIDLESVANGVLLKENTILEANAPSRAQRLLSKSDVLFQTVRPYQKNNYYFDQDGNYVASTGYAQLRSQESALFLYQIIHTNSFVNRVMARCTGTSYPTINSRDLGEIPVLIPTVPEQRKIATFLSSIDQKISLISTELNHAQSFKKSLLQQMFV